MSKNPEATRGQALAACLDCNDICQATPTRRRHRGIIRRFLAASNTNTGRPFNVLGMAAAIIGLEIAGACAFRTAVAEARNPDIHSTSDQGVLGVRSLPLSGSETATHKEANSIKAPTPTAIPADPVLSSQAQRVSKIAERNGDNTFLLVDKVRGQIFLFENGKPTVSGAALIGASMGDRVPAKVLAFPDSHPFSVEEKVTPAGRFTVRQESDEEFGPVLTFNEIHGKDWDFAIHRVYLGTPSERRNARVRSPNPLDHHITFGCIDVEQSTILQLTRKLPRKGKTPLYILPQDEAMTESFFPLHVSAHVPNAPAQ
jgi:hypothetical protein